MHVSRGLAGLLTAVGKLEIGASALLSTPSATTKPHLSAPSSGWPPMGAAQFRAEPTAGDMTKPPALRTTAAAGTKAIAS
eukprot:20889-Chlamydomonas_euryale.AAC.1